MIVTDNFVMLNFPKTGSTFTRKAIDKVFEHDKSLMRFLVRMGLIAKPYKELWLPNIYNNTVDNSSQHGCYRLIPEEDKNKTVATIIRNPYGRYVSSYLYEWWKSHPPVEESKIKIDYPTFPDLSFEQYYEMIHKYSRDGYYNNGDRNINEHKHYFGIYTLLFIQFYSKKPDALINELDNDSIDIEKFKSEFSDIVFLKQENLNNELKSFLIKMGYDEEKVNRIDSMEKVNVSNDKKNSLKNFITDEILEQINEREKLFFEMFPEYKVESVDELVKFD